MAAANHNADHSIANLTRYVTLGSHDGTYHVLKRKLELLHAEPVRNLLTLQRGSEVLKRLKTLANKKHYVKKDHILFSLAALISTNGIEADDHRTDPVSNGAFDLAQQLCETSQDLFTFVHFDKQLSFTSKMSWGRGMRKFVKKFYMKKLPNALVLDATRCKSAFGFSHRDLIKQGHVQCDASSSKAQALVRNYLLKGKSAYEKREKGPNIETNQEYSKTVEILGNLEKLKACKETETEIIRTLIEKNKFSAKQIPHHLHNLKETFEGQVDHMTLDTLIRSIPKIAELGLLNPESSGTDAERVMHRLRDTPAYNIEQISPVSVFVSMRKYDVNRQQKWIRNTNISQSMHYAYDAAIDTMMSTGKRYFLAIHIDDKIAKTCVTGASNTLSPIMPCAILAQTLARVENNVKVGYFKNHRVTELNVTKTMGTVSVVEQIIQQTKDTNNESCDICDPLKWAADKKKPFDCIVIVSGKKDTSSQEDLEQAISLYRAEANVPDSKVAIVGLSDSTQFPSQDINFLDVTGFDDDVPFLLQTFFKDLPLDSDDETPVVV